MSKFLMVNKLVKWSMISFCIIETFGYFIHNPKHCCYFFFVTGVLTAGAV